MLDSVEEEDILQRDFVTDITNGKPEFSVRIVVCDYYLTKPIPGIDVIYSEFRGSDIKQVPILRIFGPTPDGQKACLHVHGVFPYFYIPCPTPNPEPQLLYQIAASLDKALNIALKQANSANQHVYKITLVKGLPFYGFHYKEHLFLKVFLYNPGFIKQAVELCNNGAILGQILQPHESHLNFTLQFFIDFNLFGMSNIDLQTLSFRKSGVSQNSNEPAKSLDLLNLKPESCCFYEADCIASHIINRQRIGKGDGIENPGLEEVWNQELERRKKLNISITSKSLSQGRLTITETDTHYKYENMMLNKISELFDKPVDAYVQQEHSDELIHYPAETVEGSQLLNATDVSHHIQYKSMINLNISRTDNTVDDRTNNTVVDEDIAFNSSFSLHYSQILLDNDDLQLVDMLQDLDEKPIEDDSIMGTPTNPDMEDEEEVDNAEYSQIFNDETIQNFSKSPNESNENSPMWNDSFWDGANIAQLDGTCDDDHIKKVRKRKMRSFKLGLPKPKGKRKQKSIQITEDKNETDTNELEEINISREVVEDISNLHLKKCGNADNLYLENSCNKTKDKTTIVELVNNLNSEEKIVGDPARIYDIMKDFAPEAGPSSVRNINEIKNEVTHLSHRDDSDSISEDEKGIESFYDKSKLFDLSLDDNNKHDYLSTVVSNESVSEINSKIVNIKTEEISTVSSKSTTTLKKIVLTPKIEPPTNAYILSTLEKYSIPETINREPFYSNHKDVGDKVEIGQTVIKLNSKAAKDQKPFDKVLNTTSIEEWRRMSFIQKNEVSDASLKPETLKLLLAGNRQCTLTPLKLPPTRGDIIKFIESNKNPPKKVEFQGTTEGVTVKIDEMENSQAIGLNEVNCSIGSEGTDKVDRASSPASRTNVQDASAPDDSLQVTMQPDGSFLCFGNGESDPETPLGSSAVEKDFLTVMLLEVLTSVRGDLTPDPAFDRIEAVFVSVNDDRPPDNGLRRNTTEIFVVDEETEPKYLDRCTFHARVTYVDNENEILQKIIEFVGRHDPDITCGYEIEMASWGYVVERAQVLGLEMIKEISRITEKSRQRRRRPDESELEGRPIGRIAFDVWRLLRAELALSSYSFESCMLEVLRERVPRYSPARLFAWWRHDSRILRWIPVEYYLTRLAGTVRMLDKLDIINRTSELARLFGLQWWEVLSRGSQFRVESLMLRAARPLNLVALSPGAGQRAAMRAPECLPLILEPESRYYSDPVVVLDFQSLYPSMMIAYNYCFSTCIGRAQNISGDVPYEFGAWRLRIPKSKLESLVKSGKVHWSPVGVGFVQPSVRRGVLPALLRRILAARRAVKRGMRLQRDEAVRKAMHSRQLGLKLIANVTYGYTAANFSGRMPCVEVGDSVVAKGRETLERAIELVKNGPWNAKVVYGDTDSLFVRVAGATRAQAFLVGEQIAAAVTASNPPPVALKLEKVYQPCILQTKKRYVGFMYESAEQREPLYEAKGIETVRRDGCPAGVESSLCELFASGDVSRVKRAACAVLARLADGALSPRDLLFTREFRGHAAYRPGAAAPPQEIAKRLAAHDPRSAPRVGERVAWLVCAGAPGTPLVRLARSPRELLREPALAPHVSYYATRVLLPPLHRCLSLLGVDVFKWWREIGWSRDAQTERRDAAGGIARYLQRGRCAACGARGARSLCAPCAARERPSAAALAARLTRAATHASHCRRICAACCAHPQFSHCENAECPVIWRQNTARQRLHQIRDVTANLPPNYNEEEFDF